jgi:peptidoglycan hydrolase-like protein with peptidoglycan-binding domain
VTVVQQQLVAVGLTLFGGVDGVYGSATAATVKVFQRSKGLPATGSVDEATATILANAAAAVSTAVPPTAPPTSPPPTAVPPTTVPPTTVPPTTAPPSPAPPGVLSLGSRGEDVKTMQGQLIAVGIAVFGGADGVFGTATQAALKQFQTRAGLPANGVFDTATKDALAAAAAAAPSPPPTSAPTPAAPVVLAAFPLPATCAFSDTFGAPRAGGRKHQGVDIMAVTGTPIYAVVDGTITRKQVAYTGSLAGNALWLSAADHTYFFYAHLSAFAPGIEVGSIVTAGTLIGFVGATGSASVPHLHFEVHPNGGSAVNPHPVVKAASPC